MTSDTKRSAADAARRALDVVCFFMGALYILSALIALYRGRSSIFAPLWPLPTFGEPTDTALVFALGVVLAVPTTIQTLRVIGRILGEIGWWAGCLALLWAMGKALWATSALYHGQTNEYTGLITTPWFSLDITGSALVQLVGPPCIAAFLIFASGRLQKWGAHKKD